MVATLGGFELPSSHRQFSLTPCWSPCSSMTCHAPCRVQFSFFPLPVTLTKAYEIGRRVGVQFCVSRMYLNPMVIFDIFCLSQNWIPLLRKVSPFWDRMTHTGMTRFDVC
jgi:hypothetical protein